MVSKLFWDANIVLDITLQRQGFVQASRILTAGINGTVKLYTTPAVLHVASYYTKRHYSEAQTKQIFAALLNEVTIIYCSHETALLAIHSSINDLEDALQYYSALAHRLDAFISSDKKLKKMALPVLPAYTADEWLATFEI
jgi:predicted nucleic acid-binding protein